MSVHYIYNLKNDSLRQNRSISNIFDTYFQMLSIFQSYHIPLIISHS